MVYLTALLFSVLYNSVAVNVKRFNSISVRMLVRCFMVTLDEIRAKLISAIRNSGMTQTAIAKKLGIYQSAIQQYLSGRAMPALDTLANLCALLDLDANDILCIHEYAEPKKTVTVSNSFNNNSGKIDFKA